MCFENFFQLTLQNECTNGLYQVKISMFIAF